MAADYVFDSATEWASGIATSCHALDPSGKLTPGVSSEILAENVSENDLSVYLRCREGSGTVIENVGSAGDGALSGGAWKTRADGRHYIEGGTVTVPYDSSMKVAETDDNDDETTSYNWAAQIRVKFSSIAAAVFMQRSNRFQIGMDASGLPYVKNYYHISRTYNNEIPLDAQPQDEWFYLSYSNLVTGSVVLTDDLGADTGRTYEVDYTNGKIRFTSGGDYTGSVLVDYMHHEASGWSELADDTALAINTWYTIGAVCNGGSLTLYVDHEVVATLSTNYSDNDSGADLVAGFVGDWDAVMYSGNTSGSNLVSFSASGSWEKTIVLAGDKAVRYIEAEVALSDEHSINISFAFADNADDLPYVKGWSYSSFSDGYNRFYPPQNSLYHGSNLLIKVALSEGDYDREAVLIDYLKIYLREPATPLQEPVASPYEDLTLESVTAENLAQLIQQVQANRTIIQSLSRTIVNVARAIPGEEGGLGAPGFPGTPGRTGRAGTPSDTDIEARLLALEHQQEDPTWQQWGDIPQDLATQNYVNLQIIAAATGGIVTYMRDKALTPILARIATLENAGYATETYADAAVSTHAALGTEVHGVVTAQGTIQGGATISDWIAADIATHAAVATDIHGLTGGKYVLGSTAADQTGQALVSAHNTILGQHGEAAGDKVGKHAVDDHSALSTGVHGAGTDILATDADIATHSALGYGVHGVAADASQGSIQGGATISDWIAADIATHNAAAAAHDNGAGTSLYDHKILSSGVHGAAAGDPLMSLADTNTAVSNHDSSGTAHGSVESNYATHAADASAHHTKYTDGAVEVVINADLADGGSIDNAIDSLVATHESSATAHGSVESNFASHKDAQSGVHGVGLDYIAISTQSWDTVETLISTAVSNHNVASGVHGVSGSNIASEAYADGAVTVHAGDTTYVHGIDDTSQLCTAPC